MALPIQAYTVLSHFRFEAGAAMSTSDKMTGKIEDLSSAAERAQREVTSLGMAFVANFGLGATSVMGILGQSVQTFDDLNSSSLVFSNIISSNMKHLTGDIETFNDRMGVSKRILRDIAEDAKTFGLPQHAMADMTKLLAATLAPKGMAGDNFSFAREMSRNLMKSAPVLGVNAMDAQGQLLRGIQGGAGMHDPLFRALAAETEAFTQKFKGFTNVAERFNKLPLAERVQLLNTAMGQFTQDADVLAGQARTLSAMFQQFRDAFVGLNGILMPLGQSIMPLIVDAFERLMVAVETDVRRGIENLSSIFRRYGGDIESLIVNMTQLSRLSQDFKNSFLIGFVGIIGTALVRWVGFTAIMATGAKVLGGAAIAGGALFAVLAKLRPVFMFLAKSFAMAQIAMLPIIWALQTISRAIGFARVMVLEKLPKVMSDFSEALNRLTTAFSMISAPISAAIDGVARLISPLFAIRLYVSPILIQLMNGITNVFVHWLGWMRATQFYIMELVSQMARFNFRGAHEEAKKMFSIGFEDVFREFENKLRQGQDEMGDLEVLQAKIDINTLNINNEFREQMEPDRIAFTLRDQLIKTAINPTQGRGRGFRALSV